jgi:hypothetical protein
MYEVGNEVFLRDSACTRCAVAVILDVQPEETGQTGQAAGSYLVFVAGIRGERPFSETCWMRHEELEREACSAPEDKEKIGLDLLAVTGNKVGEFVFYALSEMRDLMREASEMGLGGVDAEDLRTLEEKADLIDAQIQVRRYQGYDVSKYCRECEIAAKVC